MGIYSSKVKTSNTELKNKHFYGWKKDKFDKNDDYHNFLVENKLYNIKLVDL